MRIATTLCLLAVAAECVAAAVIRPRLPFASPHGRLARRFNFTASPGEVDDYCGETTASESFGPATPLAADCSALAATMSTTDGFYTLAVGDFNTTSGWATVAASGTCAFALRFQQAADTTTALIGTNDVRFYIDTFVVDAQDGHIRAEGPIGCFNGNKVVDLTWAMQSP